MNKVVLCGRLTRNPEVRFSDNGERQLAIARYTLAVDRRGKDKGADFINCVCFDKAAEFAEKYLEKGTKILISGRLQTGSYERRDGSRAFTTDVIVEEQEFASSKSDAPQVGGQSNCSPGIPQEDGFMNIPDGVDDYGLPFH